LTYITMHPRRVIGIKIHDTLGERRRKRKEEEPSEIFLESKSVEFLVPEIGNFVETSQVKRLTDRVMMWIDAGYPPHIVGPTGCGKTTIALAVANKLGRPVMWINGDDLMTTSDLIGGYSEIETSSVRDKYVHNVIIARDRSKFMWVDNPLTLACKYGCTLIYNEFSRTKPVANNVLLSVLEEGILELPIMFGKERYIKVHPDLNIIFTSNSIEYAGVHAPQDALLDRLVHIYMNYYDMETEIEIVKSHTKIPEGEAEKVVRAVREIREKQPEESKPGTRSAIMISNGLCATADFSAENVRQIFLDVLASKIKGLTDHRKQVELIEDVLRGIYV